MMKVISILLITLKLLDVASTELQSVSHVELNKYVGKW